MQDISLCKRYAIYLVGLFLLSLGIVLIVRSALGTTPISSLNYVLSLNTPLSLGTCTFCLNLFLIIGQFAMLGHHCTRTDVIEILLQIPFSFIFSAFIDANMYLTGNLAPGNYLAALLLLGSGCIVQALGVTLELKPNVSKMSAEAFVHYASLRLHRPFSHMKITFDILLVLAAIIASLSMSGKIEGVREGSVIAALCTGILVGMISRHIVTRSMYKRISHLS